MKMSTPFTKNRQYTEHYYCALLAIGASSQAEHLLHEVRARLRQLEWTHSRILELECELVSADQRNSAAPAARTILIFTETARPDCESLRHASIKSGKDDELRVLLEAFYYSSQRIRDIFRDNKEDLPGLSGFEAAGVRTVRNHLIEHPTGKSGVIVFSFKCGGPVGPQLKALRWSLDEEGSMDNGLHANTTEFVAALERTLLSAIQQLESRQQNA
jgi:hypothetical protein